MRVVDDEGLRMSGFDVTVQALGTYLVGSIGADGLRAVTIFADEATGSAEVNICLRDDTWDARSRTVGKIVEARPMYLGEVAFDYNFVDVEDCADVLESSEMAEFSYS